MATMHDADMECDQVSDEAMSECDLGSTWPETRDQRHKSKKCGAFEESQPIGNILLARSAKGQRAGLTTL